MTRRSSREQILRYKILNCYLFSYVIFISINCSDVQHFPLGTRWCETSVALSHHLALESLTIKFSLNLWSSVWRRAIIIEASKMMLQRADDNRLTVLKSVAEIFSCCRNALRKIYEWRSKTSTNHWKQYSTREAFVWLVGSADPQGTWILHLFRLHHCFQRCSFQSQVCNEFVSLAE